MKRILFALSLLFVSAAPAWAQSGPPDGPPIDRMLEEVGATVEQRQAVRDVMEEARPRLGAFRDEAGTLRGRVFDALTAPEVDREELEAVRIEAVGLFGGFTAIAVETVGDVAALLTAEQRALLVERYQAHREGRHGRFGAPWHRAER